MESLAEHYYQKIKESTNPAPILVAMYKDLFDIDKIDSNVYAIFSKLVKIYGSELIYFSLLDCTDVPNVELNSVPINLITYFAKRRLGELINLNSFPDLTSLATNTLVKLNKASKTKLPENPFAESESE